MRLPESNNRFLGVGATGSGKTQAALWQLSLRDITARPWIIYNFKGDKGIDSIPYRKDIGLDEIPVKPGIYVVHPTPHQGADVEAQMWALWDQQGIGVYVDEGYMVGRYNKAYRALLTQGRSREIPLITLSQKPTWLDPFAVSEADFYQVFRLNKKKDWKIVGEFIPGEDLRTPPEFHSYYYDVGQNKLSLLQPVPSIEKIMQTFEQRLRNTRRTV